MPSHANPRQPARSTEVTKKPTGPHPTPDDLPPTNPPKVPPTMVCGDQDEPRYRVTRYDGDRVRQWTVTEAEAEKLDPLAVDYYQNEAEGRLSFQTEDGRRHELNGDWTGFGQLPQEVLYAIQARPGIFHDPAMLAAATGISSLGINGALASNTMRLRARFLEKGKRHWFFESRRTPSYGVRWPKARTFLRIERLPTGTARSK